MKSISKFAASFILLAASGLCSESFIVGDLMGQFANQMFVVAATTSLALDHGATPLFPDFKNRSDLGLPKNYKNVFYHLNANDPWVPIEYCYIEPHFYYDPITYRPNMQIRGWFQSEKYFKHHKQEIMDLFAPHPEIVEYLTEKYMDVISHPKTVSIHYRYYGNEEYDCSAYAICDLDYYQTAINLFPEDSLFVVFSNKIEWCKENFAHIPRNFLFVEGEAYHYDFYLMSMCKDNIICNSSFSWWAAYLNLNPDKRVIVPPHWFSEKYEGLNNTKDLIPPEWQILKE